ncbi:methyl-accepting chemotaxis protein [Deferrisoma palaeochoriense]
MRIGIQLKVGGFLLGVLALAFGVSTWVATTRATRAMEELGRASALELADAAAAQARNVFTSLETGTKGSLERGEMDQFQHLLGDLGTIEGVIEIGLLDAQGVVDYASRPESVKQRFPRQEFERAAARKGLTEMQREGEVVLLRSHTMTADCLRCHEEAKEGDLAGVLYVRYSLAHLARAEEKTRHLVAASRRGIVATGIVTGLSGLAVASLGTWFLLGLRVSRPIRALAARVDEMATGEADLTRRLPVKGRDEMAELAGAFNRFLANLQTLVREVLATAEAVAAGAEEILGASRAALEQAEAQKDRTHAAASSAEEMSATVLQVARDTQEAAATAQTASQTAEQGGTTVARGVEGMARVEDRVRAIAGQVRDLGARAEEIGTVMQVIEDIADQTNLLALNAAIEAARAGEHGRGFAVVADEVRKLAEKTGQATRRVRDTIAGIQTETGRAVASVEEGLGEVEASSALVRQGGEALREIVAQIEQTADRVSQIATATQQQSAAVEEISRNLDAVAELATRLAAAVEQTRGTAERLGSQTLSLKGLMARFTV